MRIALTIAVTTVLLLGAACHRSHAGVAACEAAGNPTALCACIDKDASVSDMQHAFASPVDAKALGAVAPLAGACAVSTGALAPAVAEDCGKRWDKKTCECVRQKVATIDGGKLAVRATEKQIASFAQAALAESVGVEGRCAMTGGLLDDDVATACSDDKVMCACMKTHLADSKLEPPDSREKLGALVLDMREVCTMESPEVRAGVVASCVSDGGSRGVCECAATAFLKGSRPAQIAEIRVTGWTTSALSALRRARAGCKRGR